ncbi:nitric oxide reductase activation protein NorD [Mycobacterium gastri]|uniref:Nitric oxide reductase activation protein n=1 Tax=Mycobacterium gastri TaxID=1777 RepID=A0A1X1VYS5_MYCGS|nr:VWA domain-containing protein [Mycobacterium gastri]ETW22520.1 von Willebrand factor, type A [Mycobacterium gastri 'Wayne']ORV75480.1 nitric oxide reductase activation protein [Mycobacterium gastri]
MTGDQHNTDRLPRLGIVASAIAARTVRVAPAGTGEPAWTDGRTIFVDAGLPGRDQLASLAVQASLLAAGSLEPDVVRALVRRPAVARRYLTVEGHRALAANEYWLPAPTRGLIDHDTAARTDSPTASLAAALSPHPIAGAPASFGAIHARKLLAQLATHRDAPTTGEHGRQAGRAPADLDDDPADQQDVVSSPIGTGGALGRLLRRMLRPVRRLGDSGQPGADAPARATRSGIRSVRGVLSTAPAGLLDQRATGPNGTAAAFTYPEWDVYRRRYRPNWCTVREMPAVLGDTSFPDPLDGCALRRSLARIGLGPDWFRRQLHGEDIDIDAAVEARVDAVAGASPNDAIYLDRLRRRRDLAALLLLDISGSVAEPGATGKTVHELQRAVAAALAVAFHDLGDRLALYAFHSQGRTAVQLVPVKRFDDALDAPALRRLGGLVPGAYSRLGAAIRHGAAVLESGGGTTRRLLVVVSDGLAYDHGYERAYGAADSRRALAEARGRGTGCVCLAVGASTDPEELERVFGSAALAAIAEPEQLRRVAEPLFRAALRSAEVRKPVDS